MPAEDDASLDPQAQRDAALSVVTVLRDAGHETYFVGGCVRDELLGLTPREFDVATAASPEQVQGLFQRNVAVGKQFGVIVALVGDCQVEVATFRSDDAYVDGRRPTGVTFSSAREDAERRDFTINGLFMDPVSGEIHDFVGGRADLDAGLLRAIGDPRTRFTEDKLRLLRAVRFAATKSYEIEPETWAAVCEMAPQVTQVSWERIRDELTRILLSGRSEPGFRLLHQSGLLAAALPEIAALEGVEQPPEYHPEGDVWTHTLLGLENLDELPDRPLALALGILFHDVGKPATFVRAERIRFDGHDRVGAEIANEVLRRLRFKNALIDEVTDLVRRHMMYAQIQEWREAKLRRFLTAPDAVRHLDLHRLDRLAAHRSLDTWTWCHEKRVEFLAEPPAVPPLLDGKDLLATGYERGPVIGKVLAAVDDERLEGRLTTKQEALEWATQNMPPPTGES